MGSLLSITLQKNSKKVHWKTGRSTTWFLNFNFSTKGEVLFGGLNSYKLIMQPQQGSYS